VFVVDTNVLLYAADASSEFHRPCRSLLEAARFGPTPWFLTWGIAYEFLRVATHPRVYARPRTATEAHGFLRALLNSPSARVLTPTDLHGAVLSACLAEVPEARGNLMHDLHTAVLMREHGISRIVTRDRDFHRFTFLDVVDPLRGPTVG
jgi:toxin-antitoxin system PIN domain toxin